MIYRHAIARLDVGNFSADPFDDAGKFVTDRHRRSQRSPDTAERDITKIAATDAARLDAHQDILRAGLWHIDLVDAYVTCAMHPR